MPLLLLFVALPLIEIALFILLGNAIGLWPTLAGVVVTAIVGSIVLRIQGIALFNEIRGTMAQGMLPARALAEAMMVAIAGALLLTPGYFTDALGALLLVPPVRAGIYAYLRTRVQVIATGPAASGPRPRTNGPRADGRPSGTIDLDEGDWRDR